MTEPLIDRPRADGSRAGDGRRASLRRPLTGRYVGGVAAGIARWFGLDPLLVRVAFVVLSLFGGSGFLLYGLAWAIVPEVGAVDGPLRVWLNSKQRPFGLLRLAAYIALSFVSVWVLAFAYQELVNGSRYGINLPLVGVRWLLGHGLQVGFLVAITLVALSVLSHDRAATEAVAPGAYAPPSPAAYAPPSPPTNEHLAGPAGDAALVENLRRRRLLIPRVGHPRSPLGWLTVGLALAGAALLSGLKSGGALPLSGLQIGAAALVILGLGLLVGAFAGWSRWLVVVVAATCLGLAPVTLTRSADVATFTDSLDSQFASHGYAEVSRSRGTEVIDLSTVIPPHIADTSLPTDDNGNVIRGAKAVTTYNDNGSINIVLSSGKVILTLPRDANWELSAVTSFGTITMPDGVAGRGFNASVYQSSHRGDGCCVTQPLPRPRAGTLSVPAVATRGQISISISVSYGDIEVRRAAS